MMFDNNSMQWSTWWKIFNSKLLSNVIWMHSQLAFSQHPQYITYKNINYHIWFMRMSRKCKLSFAIWLLKIHLNRKQYMYDIKIIFKFYFLNKCIKQLETITYNKWRASFFFIKYSNLYWIYFIWLVLLTIHNEIDREWWILPQKITHIFNGN